MQVATGDIDNLNKIQCVVNLTAVSDYRVQDALDMAANDLALSACGLGDKTTDELRVEAEVIFSYSIRW